MVNVLKLEIYDYINCMYSLSNQYSQTVQDSPSVSISRRKCRGHICTTACFQSLTLSQSLRFKKSFLKIQTRGPLVTTLTCVNLVLLFFWRLYKRLFTLFIPTKDFELLLCPHLRQRGLWFNLPVHKSTQNRDTLYSLYSCIM